MNRDQLKALADKALGRARAEARPDGSKCVDVFAQIKDGDIEGVFSADRLTVGVERRDVVCDGMTMPAYVNARDIPDGPPAGSAIYMGSFLKNVTGEWS